MSNFIKDEMLTHEVIATCRAQIEQEYDATIERVKRLRDTLREHEIEDSEREEWALFNDRVRPLRSQIEVMTKAITDLRLSRAPAPVIHPAR